jgi:hypothetical protein
VTPEIVDVASSTLIAATGTAPHGEIPTVMIGLLDEVWPYIRSNGIPADHNVGPYRDIPSSVQRLFAWCAEQATSTGVCRLGVLFRSHDGKPRPRHGGDTCRQHHAN